MRRIGMVMVLLGLLAGCAGATSPAEDGAPLSACRVAESGEALLSNEEYGYCFIYPTGYVVEGTKAAVLLDRAPGSGGQAPRLPFVSITVMDAAGRSAADAATEIAEAIPGFPIARSEIVLGGEPAVVLDGLPGQELNRQVVVVRGERLITLMFVPADNNQDELFQQMEALYATVTASFAFLPN